MLEKYLREFATVNYELVRGTGNVRICAGISDALAKVPDDAPFMLIWCDLILSADYKILDTDKNVIGISQDFQCRWSYRDGKFFE